MSIDFNSDYCYSAVIVTKLTEERDELQRQVTELTQLKERSDKIIRSLKSEVNSF